MTDRNHAAQVAQATAPERRLSRYFAPIALAIVVAAAVAVTLTARPVTHATRRGASHLAVHTVAPYWTVRPGDTFGLIAQKTDLSVAQLEAYNSDVGPNGLQPGERLNLWRHPPQRHAAARPVGPGFWTVRPGQSFGSIAASTKIDIVKLEQLNPRLSPNRLQPGERVRLRPSTVGDGLAGFRDGPRAAL